MTHHFHQGMELEGAREGRGVLDTRDGQQGALPLWRSQSSGGRTTDIWNAIRTNIRDLHVRGQGLGRHSLGK